MPNKAWLWSNTVSLAGAALVSKLRFLRWRSVFAIKMSNKMTPTASEPNVPTSVDVLMGGNAELHRLKFSDAKKYSGSLPALYTKPLGGIGKPRNLPISAQMNSLGTQ